MFDGTVTTTSGSSSYITIPATIHAEGEATLTLDKVNFQPPTGTALTVASGTVTLQNNTYNALLSGTHAPPGRDGSHLPHLADRRPE